MKKAHRCAYCREQLFPARRIPLCVSCRVLGAGLFGFGAAVGGIVWGILLKLFG
jgi:hypothetical protein